MPQILASHGIRLNRRGVRYRVQQVDGQQARNKRKNPVSPTIWPDSVFAETDFGLSLATDRVTNKSVVTGRAEVVNLPTKHSAFGFIKTVRVQPVDDVFQLVEVIVIVRMKTGRIVRRCHDFDSDRVPNLLASVDASVASVASVVNHA
jgi:hypothetical protein